MSGLHWIQCYFENGSGCWWFPLFYLMRICLPQWDVLKKTLFPRLLILKAISIYIFYVCREKPEHDAEFLWDILLPSWKIKSVSCHPIHCFRNTSHCKMFLLFSDKSMELSRVKIAELYDKNWLYMLLMFPLLLSSRWTKIIICGRKYRHLGLQCTLVLWRKFTIGNILF